MSGPWLMGTPNEARDLCEAYELKVKPRRYGPGNGMNPVSGPGVAISMNFLSAESAVEW